MATIRKRVNNLTGKVTWQAQILRKGYPAKYKTFTRRSDADTWAREVERSMDRGEWNDRSEGDSTTLREALERYLREVTPRKAPSGQVTEKNRIKSLQKRSLSKIAISKVRGKDISDFIAQRQAEGVSGNTIRLELNTLSHLYTVASTEWGLEYLSNPVMKVKGARPKVSAGRDRRLSKEEENEILRRAGSYGAIWQHLILFAIETAMRRSEIANLRWKDIDLNNRVAYVALAKDSRKQKNRQVPLSNKAVEILEELQTHDGEKVFNLSPDAITQGFSRITGNASSKKKNSKKYNSYKPINDLKFHDLRHEATSRFFEKGLNPMQVAAITGHETLAMLKRYTHLKAEDIAKLLD